ncbi:MAG: enoyl-CoA hydratase-related protein [Polyangiales bacterium]
MTTRNYRTLKVRDEGAVRTIALDVPARKNALGPELINELLWALDDAKDDDAVRVVVLTGEGGAFSAGADLKALGGDGSDDAERLALKGDFADLLLRFPAMGKPTIARVMGVAFGGGVGLVASTDFAIAAESAVLGTPEIKRGFFPMMIMAVLARVVPRRRLLEMMLLGEKLTATEAERVGLVSRVVPDAELDRAVADLATKLAALSPTALGHGLRAYHRQSDLALAEAVPELRDALFALLGTEDAQEGIRAFFEKREPVWTGK